MENQSVFYSWQSDLPNNTNRGFIQDALEKAIGAIRNAELELEPVLDRDTKDIPGAPDITDTILAKIDKATVFVADVSIINVGGNGRPTPNPNVLIELGYAIRSLSWGNVLLVFNLATGRIEDLPFDIRARRPITYTKRAGDNDQGAEKNRLAQVLKEALLLILQKDKERAPDVSIVYALSRGRFGVRNNGSTPIKVVKFVLEYPQSIEANSFPMQHPPICQFEADSRNDPFLLIYRHILIDTAAPIAAGYPDNWRLPPIIGSGETEIFEYPNPVFKSDAPLDSEVTMKIFLNDGKQIADKTTLGELLNPMGRFAVYDDSYWSKRASILPAESSSLS